MKSAMCRKALILFAALVLLCLFPGLATAQSTSPSGPSEVERAITLASPAVVFIDTSVKIHVRLIYQNSNTVSGLGHLDKTYKFDYATGSGFVITSSGAVVTASHVVEPDKQSMQNYAANKLVLEGYGYSYPSASSSPYDQYTLPIHVENVLLQQCYKGVACDFTITPIETVYTAVDIAQNQLSKGLPARILASTGFSNTDVAILQVNGTNMPTVELAETASDVATGDEVVALGFPGTSRDALQTGVTQPNKVFGHVSNIRPEGTSNLIEVDAAIQPGMSGGPVIDDSGRVVGLISFSLVQSSGESGAKYLRTIDDIKAALADAGITPGRGPVDDAFVKAMDLFWGNHFTAAVPEFEKVIGVYPGHPLATEFLAQAQTKAGTAQDKPVAQPSPASTGGGGFPVWAIAAIAAGAIIVILVIVLATRRRKPAVAPVAAVATLTPAPPSEPARAVGFQPPPAPPSGTPTQPEPVQAGAPSSPKRGGEEEPEATTHYCPSCGKEILPGARFCPSCGQRLA